MAGPIGYTKAGGLGRAIGWVVEKQYILYEAGNYTRHGTHKSARLSLIFRQDLVEHFAGCAELGNGAQRALYAVETGYKHQSVRPAHAGTRY